MLGIHPKALAVLALVEHEFEDSKVELHPAAWYNGRERGVSLSIRGESAARLSARFITFGECRNSDQLFVDTWLGDVNLNPPTPREFPEEAYRKRVYFDYNDYGRIIEHICTLVESVTDTAQRR